MRGRNIFSLGAVTVRAVTVRAVAVVATFGREHNGRKIKRLIIATGVRYSVNGVVDGLRACEDRSFDCASRIKVIVRCIVRE